MKHWRKIPLCVIIWLFCVCIVVQAATKFVNLNETELFSESYDGFSEIALHYGNIPTVSREMLLKMKTIKTIYVENGTIPTLHVTPQFERMTVLRCHTSSVLIRNDDTYEMKHFGVAWNALKELPKNLNALRQLQKLYLHDNEIEYVDMSELSQLRNLYFLSLYGNKIYEISCSMNTPVYLPKLEWLYLYSNRLADISFEHWNATAVRYIDLQSNHLSIALSFPSAFPSLETVNLANNLLNCWWKNDTLKELKSRKVDVVDEKDIKCNEASLIDEIRTDKLQAVFATAEQLKQLKYENYHLRRAFDANSKQQQELMQEALARLQFLEKQLASYNATIDSKSKTTEARLRQNADALFGAWFSTNTAISLQTGWAVLFTFIIKYIFV